MLFRSQFQQAAVQDRIQKTFGNDEKEMVNKDHEQSMMDKKIELEKVKQDKKSTVKKSVVKEARELGLIYVGSNKYANSIGEVTHINENGNLIEITK